MSNWIDVHDATLGGTWWVCLGEPLEVMIFRFDNGRKKPIVKCREIGLTHWVTVCDQHRAKGLLTMVRAPKQAPAFVIEPPPPKHYGSRWSWITDEYPHSTIVPSNTKRASNGGATAPARGQQNNRQTQGNV